MPEVRRQAYFLHRLLCDNIRCKKRYTNKFDDDDDEDTTQLAITSVASLRGDTETSASDQGEDDPEPRDATDPDGTFQKRSVLTVSPEVLNRHDYTCIIQHSSLEEEMVLQVSDNRVLSGRRNLRPHLKGKLESESVLCRHQSSFHMTSK
ncbi:hypothetical protein SRHO_G00346600 [Serrasalmus rhombeus]